MTSIGDMFGGGSGATFLGFPAARPGETRDGIAILGAPAATPYASVGAYCAAAPQAMRQAMQGYAAARRHMDFDLGGPIEAGSRPIVDCGDLAWSPTDHEANRAAIRAATGAILSAGSVPVVLGGDDSIPIPVLEAYAGQGPVDILQIDAHIDWRDEVQGERQGLSSTMRRASEMGTFRRIVQVGQRAIGSARPSDVEDARRWGAHLVPAREVHGKGIGPILEQIPAGGRLFVNLDVDALDPSIAPGVIGPAPGGLSYTQVIELLHGAAARTRLAGFSIVELVPERDAGGLTALTAARVVCNVLGLLSRA